MVIQLEMVLGYGAGVAREILSYHVKIKRAMVSIRMGAMVETVLKHLVKTRKMVLSTELSPNCMWLAKVMTCYLLL